MSDADELVLLHGRLVEGVLDDAGRDRLRVLLADAQLRRRFAMLLRVDGGLRELHRMPVTVRRTRRRPTTRSRLPLWQPALAAAVLAALGLIVWLARPVTPASAAPLAVWLDGDARPSPTAAAPQAVGPGHLRLSDGSRLELDPGCTASLAADGGVRLAQGRLRAVVVPQDPGRRLVVRTEHADVRVLGTIFDVAVGSAGTEVGVERGRVEVAPQGRPVQQVAAGAAVLVPPQGAVRPAPPPSWSIDLADAGARVGWVGKPRPDGLELAFDAEVSAAYKVPTWNLLAPDPGVVGLAAFADAGELRWEVSVARRTLVAINVQMWGRDGGAWRGTVQRQETLEPGRHRLVWPLRTFQAREGATLAAMQGMPIRKLIVVTWDGEAAVTVHRFALGRPVAE